MDLSRLHRSRSKNAHQKARSARQTREVDKKLAPLAKLPRPTCSKSKRKPAEAIKINRLKNDELKRLYQEAEFDREHVEVKEIERTIRSFVDGIVEYIGVKTGFAFTKRKHGRTGKLFKITLVKAFLLGNTRWLREGPRSLTASEFL